jgi:hypothetical protein
MYAKKIPFLFRGSLSWRKGQAKLFAFMVGCLLCSVNPSIYAAVKTHQWMENHRGYSIELRGTTPGGTDEYVAAGTVFDKGGTGLHGWHFMRLDQNGNVLASRMAWIPGGDDGYVSFRVVDVERQNYDKFWVVIQVRDQTPGLENDYIYIAGVDANGNDLAVNPTTIIKSAEKDHTNVYATNALYQHGYLYICGYVADGTQYPAEPNNTTSDKYSIMLTCDMSVAPATLVNNYTWNSLHHGSTDFDMALHISLPNNNVPVLVTGAVNSGDSNLSAVLAATFHPWGTPIGINSFLPSTYAVSHQNPRVTGVYGVDMKGTFNIANQDENEGYAILVNYFDELDLTQKTWGILRIKTDLTAYAYPNQSYIGITGAKSWANNFMTVHYDDPNTTWADVLGQQVDVYGAGEYCAVSIASPNKYPSLLNVNPFLASVAVDGANWDLTNGYTIMSGYFKPNTLHLSSVGTHSAAMDYYNGSTIAGSALEDISRLYNFGHALPKYSYASTPASLRFPPTLIAPVGVDSNIAITQTPYLKTKMIRANAAFQEVNCNNYTQDCVEQFTSDAFDFDARLTSQLYDYTISGSTFPLTNSATVPSATDCSTGLYKQTHVTPNNVVANREIKIYPNPATDNLNIVLPAQTGDKGQLHFILTDITGKVVYSHKTDEASGKTISVHLPNLAQGVYIARAELNGLTHVEKIVIQ